MKAISVFVIQYNLSYKLQSKIMTKIGYSLGNTFFESTKMSLDNIQEAIYDEVCDENDKEK